MYKQQFPMFNSIWPIIGLGLFLYSGIQLQSEEICSSSDTRKNALSSCNKMCWFWDEPVDLELFKYRSL